MLRAALEPVWTAAFVDNDSFVEPGWLERLRASGEETGATAVVPCSASARPNGAGSFRRWGLRDPRHEYADAATRFASDHYTVDMQREEGLELLYCVAVA